MTPRLKTSGPLVATPAECTTTTTTITTKNNYTITTGVRLIRRQSQQSTLAKAAMNNQRFVANAPDPAAIPRSVPQPPPATTVTAPATDGTTAPSTNDDASPNTPTPTSVNKPPPTRPPPTHDISSALSHVSLGPPAHPASLANALKAIDDGNNDAGNNDASKNDARNNDALPLTELRNQPIPEDAPYTKSISSSVQSSPRIPPVRQNSGSQTPRVRPHATTLSIPGMTRSLISPDGRIADRDVAAKLVIIMVGLPARGKSYITKKLRRYLSWQQYNTMIFNVGNRRRVHASVTSPAKQRTENPMDKSPQVAAVLSNGDNPSQPLPVQDSSAVPGADVDGPMDQSAKFFDPGNQQAFKMREEIAIETLDELLEYLLNGGGSVGILDATNSTIERRQKLFDHVKAREPRLGILFIESVCKNPELLEANMRLKLSGPDYKDKDPVQSLADFRERVKAYEKAYVPLGDYEEEHGMQYIKMTDVGKKITNFGLGGFLSSNIAHYLSSFNLSPRQIWLTRHGQSFDNQHGNIGGNAELTDRGHFYSLALYKFITHKRKEWLVEQKNKIAQSSFPPLPGDRSPPYPELNNELDEKNTCVWTSMLARSIETAQHFEADEDYDVKNWEMLNELNAGKFEGLTYEEIAREHTDEYKKRQKDKLNYVYPGVGGEGYLQVISRLRDMVREIERIKDHLVIIGHRSVCRVLMAYFMDLTRDDIADLDMPLGMLYAIEPKPYGIEFHAYKYNEAMGWFDEITDYRPSKTTDHLA